MKQGHIFLAILAVMTALLAMPAFGAEKATVPDAAQIELGKKLVTMGHCNACHTPKIMTDKGPEPDAARLLSGHPANDKVPEYPASVLGSDKWGAVTSGDFTAWAGAWGVSFGRNLTPDVNTGLGSWTADMFVKAMRTGKDMGVGRNILPPMPWGELNQLSDDELKAIFAYLHSLKPIVNAVPDPIPPPAMPAH